MARPLICARSWADGGISDTANMAWRRSCTVADSGSSCKVETPFGCRKRKGAISALDADVHAVIPHRVAFSGPNVATPNRVSCPLHSGISEHLFSEQVRTFDIAGPFRVPPCHLRLHLHHLLPPLLPLPHPHLHQRPPYRLQQQSPDFRLHLRLPPSPSEA
jgi:hypothetical protein